MTPPGHTSNCALATSALRVQLEKKTILQNINFRVNYGELVAVVGPNGAGKSTLLRALCGLLPCEGELLLNGEPLGSIDLSTRAQEIAYVPQHSELNASMKSFEVVALAHGLHRLTPGSTGADWAVVEKALQQVGAFKLAELPYDKLSYGERRLVILARALATGSRIVLLDEPTAFLDVRHSIRLHETIQKLKTQGYGFVVVLHDLDEVWRYADKALLLNSGKMKAFGPPKEGVFAHQLEQTYGVRLMPNSRLGAQLADNSQ